MKRSESAPLNRPGGEISARLGLDYLGNPARGRARVETEKGATGISARPRPLSDPVPASGIELLLVLFLHIPGLLHPIRQLVDCPRHELAQ